MRISGRNTVHVEGGDIWAWRGHTCQGEILAIPVTAGKLSVACGLIRIEVCHDRAIPNRITL